MRVDNIDDELKIVMEWRRQTAARKYSNTHMASYKIFCDTDTVIPAPIGYSVL